MIKKFNPENERIKRRYFTYLKEAKQLSEASVDAVATALNEFETYSKFRNFQTFNIKQAIAFKRFYSEKKSSKTGLPLSISTIRATLSYLERFFRWLSQQPSYKSKIHRTDADYFKLSHKENQIASTHTRRPVPTLEQIEHLLSTMPTSTVVERRDRALIAFIALTGIRDSAVISLKVKHIDCDERLVNQDAREVNTKFSKSQLTNFFPVPKIIEEIVVKWVNELKSEHLWGEEDPLFPKTHVKPNQLRQFEATGIQRTHWKNTAPIRRIFKAAFRDAGLPYYNPHSFRNMLVHFGYQICRTPEEFRVWSMNLGHARVLTSFYSYGHVPEDRQQEVMSNLHENRLANSNFSKDGVLKQLALQLLNELNQRQNKN